MADDDTAKRRREARRRKILQSPEERMKRIAGVASEKTNATSGAPDVQENNQINSETVPTDRSNDPGEELEHNAIDNTCIHKIIEQRSANKLLTEIAATKTDDEDTNVLGVTKTEDEGSRTIGEQSSDEQLNNGRKEIKWLISLRSSMLAIGLGIILRLMLIFGSAALNKQSVVAEFLVAYILWVKYNPWEDPNAASRPLPLPGLITTLLLAGVQNPALAVISRIINTITDFITNLALFIFVFVCTDSVVGVFT